MYVNGFQRVIIQNVEPEIDGGDFPARRVVEETITVHADIFVDGHQMLDADLLWKKEKEKSWNRVPMHLINNDLWTSSFTGDAVGMYLYTIEAWIDHFQTWKHDLQKKYEAGKNVEGDILIGVEFLQELLGCCSQEDAKEINKWMSKLKRVKQGKTALAIASDDALAALVRRNSAAIFFTGYQKELRLFCTRKKALFSSWYEMFPRSCGKSADEHGTFKDCMDTLPAIARMGFDVLYLPPIHPIGKTHRKGKNNTTLAEPDTPGSPWAIGSEEGGHDAIHPQLGTLQQFKQMIKKAEEYHIEIAIDLAFQCSPDHPYVKKYPEWFRWRPDGTVQYAENPPKKYEDIIPFDFETPQWKSLWEELLRVVIYWLEQGIRIFRVDNPHTKPFRFWEWLIGEVRKKDPEAIFLSEAFTRPKVMQYLAKVGFDQSYTYFTWRNTKHEIVEYLTELTRGEMREYFRPNFWPNTPDILSEVLQYGGRPAFLARLVLAATLSSNYGIYGPPFELCEGQALSGNEEYLDSEKYEIRQWNRDRPGNIRDFIALINQIRKEHPALQTTWNIDFYPIENDHLLAYGKASEDGSDLLLVVVNLDSFYTQSGWISLPLKRLGMLESRPFRVHDLITGDKYIWEGAVNYVELNPHHVPAHIFHIHPKMHREQDFDYFL
ncbi:MAG: alpha-1,4-glucan--maltose-1-phosphate maltosyltransferase [Waddliaceae bacterium]